jgi:uncharacterized protein involved in exopolysaccharide biosynthesis
MNETVSTLVKGVVAAATVGAVAFAASYLIPPSYSSYQTLYFPLTQSSSGALSAVAALKGGSEQPDGGNVSGLRGLLSNPVVASGAQTATGILTSATCYRAVVKDLGLEAKWGSNLNRALKRLDEATNVRTDKNGLLRIEATAESPALAKQIVESMYKHLRTRANDLTLNVSTRNRQLIERSLADVEKRVAQAQAELANSSGPVAFAKGDGVQASYLAAKQRLEEARLAEIRAKVELSSIQTALAKSLEQDGSIALEAVGASAENNPNLQALADLSKRLSERRLALQDASARFNPNTPEFRTAQREAQNAERAVEQYIASQKKELDAGASPALIRAQAELKALQRVSQANEALLRSYERQVRALPQAADAQTRYEALLELRKFLAGELEIAKIAEMRDPSRFEVVDPPYENEEPVGPRRVLIAGAAFLVTLALFLIPFANSRIRYED